ncbi:hypothetical protein [Shewanella polaris]|uniref:Uncharacterized protein n=1 Tax=Shewanella polaris TaxID=2588449 RepID=A0A4Y5YG91_9GAMM|nr:hypothetical protein [Shewanella polaris]QDE31734.1 hypothetical protein FH971_12630 [Shewanella polaris]
MKKTPIIAVLTILQALPVLLTISALTSFAFNESTSTWLMVSSLATVLLTGYLGIPASVLLFKGHKLGYQLGTVIWGFAIIVKFLALWEVAVGSSELVGGTIMYIALTKLVFWLMVSVGIFILLVKALRQPNNISANIVSADPDTTVTEQTFNNTSFKSLALWLIYTGIVVIFYQLS